MDVFTILLLLCISVIVILLDGYAIHRFLSPLDRQKSKAGYLCLAVPVAFGIKSRCSLSSSPKSSSFSPSST